MRLIDRRLGLVFCGFLLLFAVALARAAWLQGVKGGELRADARTQQVTTVTVPGERGRVLDRNGNVLAVSEDAATVIATPYQVKDPEGTADGSPRCCPATATRDRGGPVGSRVGLRLHRQEGQPARGRRGREAEDRGRLDAARQPPPLPAGVPGGAGDRRRRRRQQGPDRPRAGAGRHPRRRQRRAGGDPRRARRADPLRHADRGERRRGAATDDRRGDSGQGRGGDHRGRRAVLGRRCERGRDGPADRRRAGDGQLARLSTRPSSTRRAPRTSPTGRPASPTSRARPSRHSPSPRRWRRAW